MGSDYITGDVKRQMAQVYYDLKEYPAAKRLYLESLNAFDQTGSDIYSANIYLSLANIELNEKNYEASLLHLHKAKSHLKANEKSQFVTLYSTEIKVYKALHIYDKALKSYELFTQYNDSILNEKKEQIILELETKYKAAENKRTIEEQDRKIKLLNTQKEIEDQKTKKRILIMIFIAIFFTTLFFFLFLFQRIAGLKKNNILHQTQIDLMKQQLTISKNQLEPHFMLNTLNNIGYMFISENKEDAQYYFGKFASLIHRGLKYADQVETSLQEELEFIRDYLILQKKRFNGDLEFSIEVDEKIKLTDLKIPHSLLYTFVENAIKHGLAPKNDNRRLTVIVSNEEKNTLVIINDNGIGCAQSNELKTSGTGKGLHIIKNIVAGYNKLFNRDISYKVNDLTDEKGIVNGTEVRVYL